MAEIHVVQQGEHLTAIAARHGFRDHRTIWDHPRNAALKEKRRSPDVLCPGDRVVIPDKAPKEAFGAAGRRHTFRVRGPKIWLRLVLLERDRPVARAAGELEVGGRRRDLQTDEGGRIAVEIPVTAAAATLTLEGVEIPLRIGHLDPAEEPSGWRARLANLGYYEGPLDEPDAAELRSAIEEFQCDHPGLKVDGICGPRTQARLRDVHGC